MQRRINLGYLAQKVYIENEHYCKLSSFLAMTELLGFSPSQLKKVEQVTILDEITGNRIEMKI